MIDIEKKILQIFRRNEIIDAQVLVDLNKEGRMVIVTSKMNHKFDDLKSLDSDLQNETYFTIQRFETVECVEKIYIKFDYEIAACNTDCACYCSGTCPFQLKMQCGRVRSKVDELAAYARVTCDKEVRV